MLYKKTADNICLIYGYKDDGSNVATLDFNEVLEIPEGVEKVKIKKNAFNGNDTLTKIIVSADVTEIEAGAFAGMKKLERLEVPFIGRYANSDAFQNESASAVEKAVDAERTIAHFFGAEEYDDGFAMTINYGAGSTTCYVPTSFKDVVVNATVAYSIPRCAFNGAKKLQSITIKGEIDAIGAYAFANTIFASIEIPATVKNIYEGAFENAKIKFVNFVAGASEIVLGNKAFAGCALIERINSEVDKTIDLEVFSSIGKDALDFDNEIDYNIVNEPEQV